jgi:hypothetical protein
MRIRIGQRIGRSWNMRRYKVRAAILERNIDQE